MFSQKHTFKILACHFPPGFFAEGRRRLATKLVNSNMGNNMGINMGINMGNNMRINIGIPYKFPINSLFLKLFT